MAQKTTILTVTALAMALSACGGSGPKAKKEPVTAGFDVRKLIGAEDTAPDEFAVIMHRPLEMPKDLTSLPAPDPGARSSRAPDAVSEARQALLPETGPSKAESTGASAGETALLAAIGTTDPNIRTLLEAEHAEDKAGQKTYLLDSVLPRNTNSGDILKPHEEYKRLRSEQESTLTRAPQDAEIALFSNASSTNRVQAPAPQLPPVIPSSSRTLDSSVVPSLGNPSGSDADLIYIPE